MRPMGVITCAAPMNTSGNDTYLHKKFKRAPIEASEAHDHQHLHPSLQREGPPGPFKAASPCVEAAAAPSNGLVAIPAASTPAAALEGEEARRRNGRGGKYKCEYCGMGCAKPSVLDKHKRTHTNERPYSCSQCSTAFKTKSNYLKHTRSRSHAQRCDGPEGSDGAAESGDNGEGEDPAAHCPMPQPCQPADLSQARNHDPVGSSSAPRGPQEPPRDQGAFIYKHKFKVLQPFSPGLDEAAPARTEQQATPASLGDSHDGPMSVTSTYHAPTSTLGHPGAQPSLPGLPGHPGLPRHCRPLQEVRAAPRKEDVPLPGPCSPAAPLKSMSLWGIKSPSPELVGQHINKLIVENEAIIETHNPLWPRRYKRQPSLGSSSSESDSSSGGRSRRGSLVDVGTKSSKGGAPAPAPTLQGQLRDRSQSLASEAAVADAQCAYGPCLPPAAPAPHPTLAQPVVSASKPSISLPGLTTSYSQSPPPLLEPCPYDPSRKRCVSEGPGTPRDLTKGRPPRPPEDQADLPRLQHPRNPEGSVIKNLLLGSTGPRFLPPGDAGPFSCPRCRLPCRSIEDLDMHMLHYCGQRPALGGERCTPDLAKNGEGGRWVGEQDVALDLQKKPDPVEAERSSSRGSVGAEEHHRQTSPKVYRSRSVPEGASPPVKKRKPSASDERPLSFPPKGLEAGKLNNHQLFGGEVQICDGHERKTLRIDPGQTSSPSLDLDLCIPPQQLGAGGPAKADAAVPTSVVVTIARSGLHSGGTMVQVESQLSTATKTTPSMAPTTPRPEQPPPPIVKVAPASLYGPEVGQFPSFPSFREFAPHLQLPNLAIPGIPAPDLASLSFTTYCPRVPNPALLLTQAPPPPHTPLNNHKQALARSPVGPPRASPTPPFPGGHGPASSGVIHGGSGRTPGSESAPGLPQPRDKEKEALVAKGLIRATGQAFPTLIPIGDTKVPHVPGIPGPYSQPSLVCPPPNTGQRRPPPVFTLSSQTPSSFTTSITSVPAGSPREPGLAVPRHREPPRSPGREHGLAPVATVRLPQRLSPKDLLSPRPRPSVASPRVPDLKPIAAEAKPPPSPLEDKASEKTVSTAAPESREPDSAAKSDEADQKEFLPPRKRPDFLALKPQPFTPKSSLALIGTTLVSPDTPRPKKSCVQMFLNGSAYTYLGHKVSTKSYFCCIYRPQPMFVLQSTDPKLSMYSNWQSKPAKEHPFKLEPFSAMGLYQSCKRDRTFTVARPKELHLIQTHSSYWTFRQEKDKHRDEDEARPANKEATEVKSEEPGGAAMSKTSESSMGDSTSLVIKREAEDALDGQGRSSDDSEGAEGSSGTKRIKIFEGGFKSTEDYTYVRGRGRGRYVCGTCGIRCKKPSMLRKHCRTHTDLRPYACTHCSFSFKTKGNLTKHLRSKAHYKRCVEMGVVPVPTVVDESHVNEAALALQGKLEQERKPEDGEDDDDDEDDDEEEDGDEDDEDDEDDVTMDDNQFQDAANERLRQGVAVSGAPIASALGIASLRPGEGAGAVPTRSGVLVMQHGPPLLPSSTSAPHTSSFVVSSSSSPSSASISITISTTSPPSITTTTTTTSSTSSTASPSSSASSSSASPPARGESTRDSPMDLSVRRGGGGTDKAAPRRPSFLPVLSRPSVLELSTMAASPSTPSTPIREHPSEILSPVTETSSLLKSIYQTTERAAQASCVVPDPSVESGSSRSMLHAYLKERAVLDTAIKRQQYSSSSDGSPDSPHLPPGETQAQQQQKGTVEVKDVKETQDSTPSAPFPTSTAITITATTTATIITTANQPSSSASSSSSSSSAASTSSSASRMPTPPANLTVMNSGGPDTKTAFLVPSGVVPSSLNRLSSDDGKCKCTFCHKEFNRQSQLSLHMNIHYMERPFRCESCAVSFRTNGHLQKHKRSVSHFNKVNMNNTFGTPSTDNPRPFKCHDCKIAFRIHGHLAKHLRSKMHIMKLECLGKLPFGTYAEIERSGANLNEIDTTDCDNSLESLQAMASRLYEKEPTKLAAWRTQQGRQHQRVRTISNSSTNSDDYPLQDDQDDPMASCGHDEDTEGDDDEEVAGGQRDGPGRTSLPGGVVVGTPDGHTQSLPSSEVGGLSATPGMLVCHLCHENFLDLERLSGHLYSVHKVTYRNS